MSSDSEQQDATSPPAPEPTNIAEPISTTGKVTSAILSKEESIPDNLEDDDDDDIVTSKKRGGRTNGRAVEEEEEADDGDLFGDGSDEEAQDDAPKKRQLDDEELDSGDDMDRNDRERAASGTPAPEQQKEELVQYSEFGRQPMYLLKVPKFLSLEPTMFDTPSFSVPEKEHHSRQDPPPTFSAFNTAMSTIRWRHSPADSSQLQSNARILRWSDGSLTLQLASDPTQQYEIDGNALAPPQKNALKPTPTSTKAPTNQETYTYLTVPHESVGLLRTTHKITAGLSVMPSQKTTDDALERLQSSLAAAVRGKNAHNGTGIEVMPISEDPELMRRKAELAEKEKDRAQKRRMAAENRDRDRSNRALGRSGLTSGRYGSGGGLTAGMLEDDEMGGQAQRPRAKPKASRRQRNDEYSSDEDLGRRRGNFANDDYEVDDFVAGSDEEEDGAEEESEEEDVDDGIDLGKAKGGKRREREDEVEDESDAEGEVEDEDVRQAPKAKRRRAVVDDEDDDE
ncbi:Leo1-like protein [Elsinoe australis]|uniref:Leo1-like protein n=1 Tax=Elsinoe australis TaxID=40998 RepID=A0A4V6DTW9_9PEZI|nr:Leo1-like protein [Elsinoe australis]